MKICDLKEGTKIFNETFLINDVVKKTANNGTIFLSFIFQDNSGLINGIKWVVLPEETNLYKKNMAIIIRSGRVVNYNNRLQLTIEEMRDTLYNYCDKTYCDDCVMNNLNCYIE